MNDDSVKELRDQGYSVIIFSPDELRGTPTRRLEDSLIERGWDIIADMMDDNEGTCTKLLVYDGYCTCGNEDAWCYEHKVMDSDCARCLAHHPEQKTK